MKPLHRVATTKRFNHSGVGSSSTINKSFGLGTVPCKVVDYKHGSWLLEKLNELRLNGDMTDITFAFNGKQIRANQVILAAVSPILCELFKDRENFLNAEILPPECLKEAIDFIYSASIEVALPGLVRLQQAAQILQMPIVCKMCQSALENVSHEINVRPVEPLIRKSSARRSYNSEKSLPKSVEESDSLDSCEETEDVIRPTTGISNERNSIKMTFHSTNSFKDDLSPDEVSNLSRIATLSKNHRHNNSLESIPDETKKEVSRRPRSGSDITSMASRLSYPLHKKTLIESPIRESLPKKYPNNEPDEKPIKKTPICQDTFRLAFRSKVLPGFLKGLNSLREECLFCDLVFIVENTKIPCHRAVMAASSTVFETILRRIKIREIILKKVEDTSLLELIRFIYSGQCIIERENVTATMRAANRFRLHYIANHCACYLERNAANSGFFLSVDNVLITYKLTNVYGCPKFRDECYKFIISKFWEVVKVSDFYDLSLNELNRIVTNEALTHSRTHCSDFDMKLFNVLSDWLKYKPMDRIPHMTSSVLKFVKFQNIEMSVLKNVISKDGLAMSDEETHQRVSAAMLRQFNASQKCLSTGSSKYGVYEAMSEKEHNNSLLTWSIDGQPFTFTTSFNTEKSKWEKARSAPVKLLNYAVTSHQGVLFVSGGSDPTIRSKCVSSEVHMLNNGKWTRLPDMRIMRYNHAFTYQNDNLVVIGGIANDRDSVTSIEVLDIAKWKSDPKTKWKINKLSLPTPNHNHYATPIQIKATSYKDNKTDRLTSPSPKFKKSFGQRLSASSTAFQDAVTSPGRSSSVRLKKVLTVSNSIDKHSSNNLVFLLMGGEFCPRQNLQCDLTSGKLVVKSPLPQDCFHPSSVICNSFIFVIPNDSTDFSDDLLQYSPSDDVWTKLYNPFAVEISSMCSCLINFPRKASTSDKIVSKICGYEKDYKLHVMIIQERNAAVFEYDSEQATWSTPIITDLDLPIDPESGGFLAHWYTYFTA